MKNFILLIFAISTANIFANEGTWNPKLNPAKGEGLIDSERKLEVYQHGTKAVSYTHLTLPTKA